MIETLASVIAFLIAFLFCAFVLLPQLGKMLHVLMFFVEFFSGLLKGDKACWCNVIGFTVLGLLGCTLWGWLQIRESLLVFSAKYISPAVALGLIGLVAWLKPVHETNEVILLDGANDEKQEESSF